MATIQDDRGITFGQGNPMPAQLTGRNLVAAGKKTDATSGGDATITTAGFQRLFLDCSDCTAEMTFTIDEAISGATKPIYVRAGATLDLPVQGSVLHYRGAGTFRYVML